MLRHPEQPIFWVCNWDDQRRLTSVYLYRPANAADHDRKGDYLSDEAEARRFFNTLKSNGWTECEPPKIVIKDSDGTILA